MQPSDGWQEVIQYEENINVKIAKIIFQSNGMGEQNDVMQKAFSLQQANAIYTK